MSMVPELLQLSKGSAELAHKLAHCYRHVDVMGKSPASNAIKKFSTQQALSGRSNSQILSALCNIPLSALVLGKSVRIAVPEQVAATLHEYAVGSSDGGPTTALHTAFKLSQLTETALSPNQVWSGLTTQDKAELVSVSCASRLTS